MEIDRERHENGDAEHAAAAAQQKYQLIFKANQQPPQQPRVCSSVAVTANGTAAVPGTGTATAANGTATTANGTATTANGTAAAAAIPLTAIPRPPFVFTSAAPTVAAAAPAVAAAAAAESSALQAVVVRGGSKFASGRPPGPASAAEVGAHHSNKRLRTTTEAASNGNGHADGPDGHMPVRWVATVVDRAEVPAAASDASAEAGPSADRTPPSHCPVCTRAVLPGKKPFNFKRNCCSACAKKQQRQDKKRKALEAPTIDEYLHSMNLDQYVPNFRAVGCHVATDLLLLKREEVHRIVSNLPVPSRKLDLALDHLEGLEKESASEKRPRGEDADMVVLRAIRDMRLVGPQRCFICRSAFRCATKPEPYACGKRSTSGCLDKFGSQARYRRRSKLYFERIQRAFQNMLQATAGKPNVSHQERFRIMLADIDNDFLDNMTPWNQLARAAQWYAALEQKPSDCIPLEETYNIAIEWARSKKPSNEPYFPVTRLLLGTAWIPVQWTLLKQETQQQVLQVTSEACVGACPDLWAAVEAEMLPHPGAALPAGIAQQGLELVDAQGQGEGEEGAGEARKKAQMQGQGEAQLLEAARIWSEAQPQDVPTAQAAVTSSSSPIIAAAPPMNFG